MGKTHNGVPDTNTPGQQSSSTGAGGLAPRAGTFASLSEGDRARLLALRQKRERGEPLSDEERKFARGLRARMQQALGGGAGGATLRAPSSDSRPVTGGAAAATRGTDTESPGTDRAIGD